MSIQWSIETHDRAQSTQMIVKGMADIGAPEGSVVHADEQIGGYGRHGRVWVSEPGNLYTSVLLRPACDITSIGQLSIMTGLAVGRTIENYINPDQNLAMKWPNDVLIQGKKSAGIILETSLTQNMALKWLAIGIGINVKSGPDYATAIKYHSQRPPKVTTLRAKLLSNIDTYYNKWNTKGFDAIKKEWLEYGHKKDDKISVKLGDKVIEGYFHDIDNTGALVIRDNEYRVQVITAGEVYT